MKEGTRSLLAAQVGRLAVLVALSAGWVLLAWQFTEPPASLQPGPAALAALAVVLGSGWAGWAVRQAWLFPAALQRAERQWAQGGPAEGVESILNGALLARGELGYRILLLRAKALQAQGRAEEAWASSVRAELARLPFPVRWWVAPRLRPGQDVAARISAIQRARRFAPRMAHLPHLAAALRLRSAGDRQEARSWLAEAVALGAEDPLLLEDILLAAMEEQDAGLAGKALAQLLARHQDPRLRWNRAAGAALLLREGRAAEAAALAASVPAAERVGPELWALEAAARRRLGDLDGAEDAISAGLERHPGDFRLWMESHALALEDRAFDDAFADLEAARKGLEGAAEELHWEWNLRRAEFAWWVDGDLATAETHLALVPEDHRGPQLPPLRLHLRAARGDHAEVLLELETLERTHPDHEGIVFLRAECLAGLEHWDALDACLQGMNEAARGRAQHANLSGRLLVHRNRKLDAREELERAARLDPDNLQFVLDAGHACADLGEWDRSELHWKQALRLDEGCGEALLELAESRLALHDRAGAVRYLRECLLHHPEDPEAQERLAELESH